VRAGEAEAVTERPAEETEPVPGPVGSREPEEGARRRGAPSPRREEPRRQARGRRRRVSCPRAPGRRCQARGLPAAAGPGR